MIWLPREFLAAVALDQEAMERYMALDNPHNREDVLKKTTVMNAGREIRNVVGRL